MKYCVMAISRNSNLFLMGIERSLSQKEIVIVYENIPVKSKEIHKIFLMIFIENEKKHTK